MLGDLRCGCKVNRRAVVYCSVLSCRNTHTLRERAHTQPTSTHCNTLQHTAAICNTLQHTASRCNTLHHTATKYNTLQHTASHCNTLQHNTTHCNTHCNTLQHTATHCIASIREDFFLFKTDRGYQKKMSP